jgi:hypothetical protein
MKQVYAWFERWQPAGKIADGGVEMRSRDTAKMVCPRANGEPVITDGRGDQRGHMVHVVHRTSVQHRWVAATVPPCWMHTNDLWPPGRCGFGLSGSGIRGFPQF